MRLSFDLSPQSYKSSVPASMSVLAMSTNLGTLSTMTTFVQQLGWRREWLTKRPNRPVSVVASILKLIKQLISRKKMPDQFNAIRKVYQAIFRRECLDSSKVSNCQGVSGRGFPQYLWISVVKHLLLLPSGLILFSTCPPPLAFPKPHHLIQGSEAAPGP